MKTRVLSLACVLTVLSAPAAWGQTCLGLPSLETRPRNLLVQAQFDDAVKQLGARFGFGSSVGYGGISGGIIDFDGADGVGIGFGGDAGLSLLVGERKNIAFCPNAALNFTLLPDDIGTQTSGKFGVALGTTLTASPGLVLVPFGSLSGVYARTDPEGDFDSSSDTYAVIGAGLGLQLASNIIIRPELAISFGDGSDVGFGIGVAFPFGTRGAVRR